MTGDGVMGGTGTGMQITEITTPGADFDRWYDVYRAADEAGRPHARPWSHEELAQQLHARLPGRRLRVFLGMVEQAAVCAGSIEFSTSDNLDSALVEVHVRASVRRRGLGSDMLQTLLGVVAQMGRRIVSAETSYPYECDGAGTGCAGPEFLRAHGFTLGLADIQRVLDLDAAMRLVPALLAGTQPFREGYQLSGFVGAAPTRLAESLARIQARLQVEAPVGEMSYEARAGGVQTLREQEELLGRQGRVSVTTVALAPDDTVAGYTHVVVPLAEPGVAYQWGTLVAGEHRGHRLGLALKAANLGLLRAEFPATRAVVTYNAEVNDHMVAINDRLGFRPVERLGEFQRRM